MFRENIETMVTHLENLISTKTIVGDPIISGSATIIPLVSASVGFGLGTGEGQDGQNQGGKGSGGGAGIKLSPAALLVIQGESIRVYDLTQKGSLAKLAEIIPDVIDKFKPREKSEQ